MEDDYYAGYGPIYAGYTPGHAIANGQYLGPSGHNHANGINSAGHVVPPVQLPSGQLPPGQVAANFTHPSNYPGQSINFPTQTHLPDDHVSAYPDFTTYLNNNPNQPAPTVDAVFMDQITCPTCGRNNFKSLKRHIKIHQSTPRFRCRFPRLICSFKINTYNRAFDFKRHLTNKHFKFDNPEAKRRPGLTSKLECVGSCPCGRRSTARDWLEVHVLGEKCELWS